MASKPISKSEYESDKRRLELELLRARIALLKRNGCEYADPFPKKGRTLDKAKGRVL